MSKTGRWASKCPEGHEPGWLEKQTCFKCGQIGHIKSQCSNIQKDKIKYKHQQIDYGKPPHLKKACYFPGVTLQKLVTTLPSIKLCTFKSYTPLDTISYSDDPRSFRQREEKWFHAR